MVGFMEDEMRFKEFTNIDSLRHAKVDEKPVRFFNGNLKNENFIDIWRNQKFNLARKFQ